MDRTLLSLARRHPRWLFGLLGLVVLLLARAGHATLIHSHGDAGAHVHLLTLEQAAPGKLAAWHAHHHGHGDESVPAEGAEEHAHGHPAHGVGLLVPPLFVLAPALGTPPGAPPVALPCSVTGPVPLLGGVPGAPGVRERDPPGRRARSGHAAVLLRNHSIRI